MKWFLNVCNVYTYNYGCICWVCVFAYDDDFNSPLYNGLC